MSSEFQNFLNHSDFPAPLVDLLAWHEHGRFATLSRYP